MVESLGFLDAAFGPGANPDSVYNLACKEKGKLSDTSVIDTAAGTPVALPPAAGIDPLSGAAISRPSVELVVTGTDSNGPNGYALHHEPQLRVPYLPDPLSRGATLCGLPGLAVGQAALQDPGGQLRVGPSVLPPEVLRQIGSVTQIGFGTDWPERLRSACAWPSRLTRLSRRLRRPGTRKRGP
jgi:hypothetical protein